MIRVLDMGITMNLILFLFSEISQQNQVINEYEYRVLLNISLEENDYEIIDYVM